MIRGLLALALVVLVPLAWSTLHETVTGRRWIVAAGSLASLMLLVEPGAAAAGGVVPWLALAVREGGAVAGRLRRTRPHLDELAALGAQGWWVAGAAVLLWERTGGVLPGVDRQLTLLTAVHFHYAGVLAPLLALLVARSLAGRSRSIAVGIGVALVLLPAVIALGFTWAPSLLVFGAVTEALMLLVVSVLLACVARGRRGAGRVLLLVAAASSPVAMALAVTWAASQLWPHLWAPSIPAMAATHGVLNALGFCLCGLFGLRVVGPTTSGALARSGQVHRNLARALDAVTKSR